MYYLYKKKDNLIVWKDDMHGLLEMHSILAGDISIAWKICRVSKDQIRQVRRGSDFEGGQATERWIFTHTIFKSDNLEKIIEMAALEGL